MAPRSLLGVALIVTACTTAPSPTPPASTPGATPASLVPADVKHLRGAWLLLMGSVDDTQVPMPDKTRTTIAFIGDEFGGQTACNRYGGHLQSVGNLVTFGEIQQTLMGCAEEVTASERTFLAGLRGVTAVWLDDEELVLTGPRVELRFSQLAEVLPDLFVDREWVLAALIRDGEEAPPGGLPATLLIGSDGTFSGSTGCRTFRGMWIASADQIRVTAIDLFGGQCPQFLEGQDNHVVGVIDAAIPTLDGEELTLRAVNGAALVYRLAPD